MLILLWGTALLGIGFFVHVIIWRWRKPANSAIALVTVFLSVLILGVAGALIPLDSVNALQPRTILELAQIVLFFFAGMSAYINTFPAIETESPSLAIALLIQENTDQGLTRDDIHARLDASYGVLPAYRNLVAERMVTCESGIYRLTRKGRLIARIFHAYRLIIGKEFGG